MEQHDENNSWMSTLDMLAWQQPAKHLCMWSGGALWPRNPKALVWGGSAKTTRCSTGYVRLRSEVDIPEFKVALEGHRFPGRRGGEAAVAVEYAPFQRVPASKVKRDPKEGTIEQGVLSALVYVRAHFCGYTFWSVDKGDPRGASIEQIVLPVLIYIPCISMHGSLLTLWSVDIHGNIKS